MSSIGRTERKNVVNAYHGGYYTAVRNIGINVHTDALKTKCSMRKIKRECNFKMHKHIYVYIKQ